MGKNSSAARKLQLRGLESGFDAAFSTGLALKEKQIQQNYRPIIGIHKWFARRPGTLFRSLMLAEFCESGTLKDNFWIAQKFRGVIGDPFMGGGTPVFEANRLGFHVVGCDINPMAHWIVRQSLSELEINTFRKEAERLVQSVQQKVDRLYQTTCLDCGKEAEVKYFMWVKTAPCPKCHGINDLFPGYLLAEAVRHPKNLLLCSGCGTLNEFSELPTRKSPAICKSCEQPVHIEGNVSKKKLDCCHCGHGFSISQFKKPPAHRMWAIEYHCEACYHTKAGRQFKAPDANDLKKFHLAKKKLASLSDSLPIPEDPIPAGDESDRLHRWGYSKYRELFNERQLLGLGFLLKGIVAISDIPVREALLTVFSDTLRYQNMLCRYDTYALKCQDIFSIHGFPVGLIQCENNLLGIEKVGSGAFVHFVEKYIRAKQYCLAPFETRQKGGKKETVPIPGETIKATLVSGQPSGFKTKQAFLINQPSQAVPLTKDSLDGVFTDPPYYDNVQYAELIDFCFVWLRQVLGEKFPGFRAPSTRSAEELTGNETEKRGLEHFTNGLSEVFTHFAQALKVGGPFVFTYHHNDPTAYLPLVVAILDAQLICTATLPAAGEMSASLHIAKTGSSILDSVFVCRKMTRNQQKNEQLELLTVQPQVECFKILKDDGLMMQQAGVRVSKGDLRCLMAGHVARLATRILQSKWDRFLPLKVKMDMATECIKKISDQVEIEFAVTEVSDFLAVSKRNEPSLVEK